MKILWITNILFPDICDKVGIKPPVTGGWMSSSASAILKSKDNIELAVATLFGKTFRVEKIKGITYYCLPFDIYSIKKYEPAIEKFWKLVADDFKPDIVHIHGTEYPHGLAYIKGIGISNVVVSIQGLVSGYARYSLGHISERSLRKHRTLYDFLKEHIMKMPIEMSKAGEIENEYIRLSHHVIGRTDWDKDHIWAINPRTKYHFCNETLREPFYTTEWKLNSCERHSIFLSQAYKPIKGIHKIIEALPYVIRSYPDVKVYVAGIDFTKTTTLKDKLRFSTYANYISHLMTSKGVRDRFIFTGLLDENEMAKQYKRSHVFICPSSIENSPNSLGEAQLIGTPVIASYVGGIPNMIENGVTGMLYRFEEHEMLARCICNLFENDDLAINLSRNERATALKRHDRKNNAVRTIEIYNEIINEIQCKNSF